MKNLETTNTDFDLANLPPAVKLLVLDKMSLKVDDIVADVTKNVGPPPDIFDFDSSPDWKSGVSLLTSEEIETIQDQGNFLKRSKSVFWRARGYFHKRVHKNYANFQVTTRKECPRPSIAFRRTLKQLQF